MYADEGVDERLPILTLLWPLLMKLLFLFIIEPDKGIFNIADTHKYSIFSIWSIHSAVIHPCLVPLS